MKPLHTLLATTGASPQVVTETLYALHQSNGQWPDEIVLITTSFGTTKAVQGLLTNGNLRRLCQELHRPEPAFDAGHVLAVPGADGRPVEDARSLADHEALANFIMTEVRNRTAKSDGSLHASLAGGRKTMTFYIGYAMSLFGRPQDTLSHVLVSDGYEGIPDFWYPTTDPARRHVQTRTGVLDASAAEVTLAPIPFVRHRRNLPKVLLQAGKRVDFAELVQLINLGDNPEDIRIRVDLAQRSVQLSGSNSNLRVVFDRLSLIDLAFYAMLARATVSGDSDFCRPAKADKGLARSVADELLALCRIKTVGSLSGDLDLLIDSDQIKSTSLESLRCGMNTAWFDSRKNSLGNAFEQKLPLSLVGWVAPGIIWTEDGRRLPMGDTDRTPKGGGYGIALQSVQIMFVEAH